jgi:predicted aldo/keto reductase-like oxidoreductase
MEKKNNKIRRRDFLKTFGGGAAITAASLYGCNPKDQKPKTASLIEEAPKDKMTYRINHNSNDKVSLLGYGCMRWPLRKNSKGEDEVDQDTVNQLVDYAIEHGVNYFDTAPVYVRGWSEAATGIALSRHSRDKYFIATKMSNQRDTPQMRSLKGCMEMYHKSMEDLQVDYLDYYLLHSIGGGNDGVKVVKERFYNNGALNYLLKEREAGRIRNLGFSFHGDIRAYDFLLTQHEEINWDFVQIQLNYIDWQHATAPQNTNAEYLLGELEKRNIPAVIMEPLLGGRLSRVSSQALNMMKQMHPEDTAAKWAFRYAGTPESVLTVLSGMVYMEHLQENIRTYSPLVPINKEESLALDKITKVMLDDNYIQCTECQYCMPCPYGLDIPGVFGHYNRCVSEGTRLTSSKDENYRKSRQAFLVGYDRSVPKLRQADHCISCELCKPKCPQRINIPFEMKRINQYVEHLKQQTVF